MLSFSDLLLWAEYKNRPLGSICGQKYATSPWARSGVVNWDGVPPDAATCNKPPSSRLPNRIRPSPDQAPPVNVPGMSQMLANVPCTRSNARSLLPLANATDLLSGDQNGAVAPVVPGRRWASVASTGRTQTPIFPLTFAMKAAVRPSGDIAKPPAK